MPVILKEAPQEFGIGIRHAILRDLPRIMEIELLTFGKQWDYFQFKASLDDVFLVAVDAATGDVVGFLVACCCTISQRGIILRIAVHPNHQGRGIGTDLIHEAFKELKRLGLHDVELDVDIVKPKAQRLYEKLGFQVAEVISISDEDDDSFYVMRKRLD